MVLRLRPSPLAAFILPCLPSSTPLIQWAPLVATDWADQAVVRQLLPLPVVSPVRLPPRPTVSPVVWPDWPLLVGSDVSFLLSLPGKIDVNVGHCVKLRLLIAHRPPSAITPATNIA